MCHVSLVPVTWCGPLLGLVGSQLLDESQMRWSSGGSGTEARSAERLMKIDDQKSAIRCRTTAVAACLKSVTNSKSVDKLAHVVARVQGLPAIKERRTATPATKAGHCLCSSPQMGCASPQ